MSDKHQQLDDARNLQARRAAQAAAERLSVNPTGLVRYQSRGRVLVIGGEEAQWLAARLAPPLRAEVLQTDGDDEPGVPSTPVAGRPIRIDGHLGEFRIELGEAGRHDHQVLQVDLVADLGAAPLIDRDIPPPGYWHFGTSPQDLDSAVDALDGMVGTFEKPRYFAYDPAICAHNRSGQPGCRRCIDACPAEAIISIGERVEVNPNLCQGGGICASVCPSGAMQYAYPSPQDTAERIRVLLRAYREAGGTDPVLMLAAESDVPALPPTPPNVLLVVVEELASVGHEVWLSALAWGARCVLLADRGSVPPSARHALDEQVTCTHALLEGLDFPAGALRLIEPDSDTVDCAPAMRIEDEPATFAAGEQKRQLAYLAIDHLWSASALRPERFPLPAGAPYGEVRIDTEKCTLCLSCTSVCPARALSAGDDTPKVVFHEVNCVQCGICENACPEDAISLAPRLLGDPQRRRQPVTLHEEPPFCCVSCGKPFATRRVIDNIIDKLAGHAMFQSERARRRLQMCEDCRVVDAVQDSEAMQAGLFAVPPNTPKNHR